MAQYIRIPKDLDDIREKFMFNLTKRQCLCFGIGFLIGIPVFFLTRKYGIEIGVICMGFAAAPAIICGIYKTIVMTKMSGWVEKLPDGAKAVEEGEVFCYVEPERYIIEIRSADGATLYKNLEIAMAEIQQG